MTSLTLQPPQPIPPRNNRPPRLPNTRGCSAKQQSSRLASKERAKKQPTPPRAVVSRRAERRYLPPPSRAPSRTPREPAQSRKNMLRAERRENQPRAGREPAQSQLRGPMFRSRGRKKSMLLRAPILLRGSLCCSREKTHHRFPFWGRGGKWPFSLNFLGTRRWKQYLGEAGEELEQKQIARGGGGVERRIRIPRGGGGRGAEQHLKERNDMSLFQAGV